MPSFIGTPANDISIGADWDSMVGFAGNDKLNDTGNNPSLIDQIYGQDGNDLLYFTNTASGYIVGGTPMATMRFLAETAMI